MRRDTILRVTGGLITFLGFLARGPGIRQGDLGEREVHFNNNFKTVNAIQKGISWGGGRRNTHKPRAE